MNSDPRFSIAIGRDIYSACQTPQLIALAVALLATAVAGCGGPETAHVELIRVRGVVTLDEKPLEKAVVIFESPDGSFSYAETDADGTYDLNFDSAKLGTTAGPKTVRISMNRRIYGLNSNDEGRPDDTAGGSFKKQPPELVPERYNAQSELTANVTKDSGGFDFHLKTRQP